MPRPTRAQGRPGTRVIPKHWTESHRPVVEKTLTATVELRRPGGTKGPLDPNTDKPTFTPNAPYQTGGARIQVLARADQAADAGDQPVQDVAYLVVLSLDDETDTHPVTVDDLLDITEVEGGDPTLVGRTLVIESISRGSLAWERDLQCRDYLDHPTGEGSS